MAINAINTFITSKGFGTKISAKAKSKLSAAGCEQYIFEKNLVLQWCSWIQSEVSAIAGITISGHGVTMAAKMFRTLKTEFRKQASGGVHIAMENDAFVVTQVSRSAASFQRSGSSANDAIRKGKKAAIDVIAGALTPTQKQKLMATMHGHHADVREPGHVLTPKTTGGLLKAEKDVGEHRATKGMSSDASLTDIMTGIDQRSQSDSLYHVVLTRLSNHIDCLLGFDRAPVKMLPNKRARKSGMKIEVDNIIHIRFALGTGSGGGSPSIGTKYKQAMNDWDAGRGGGLTANLNKILDSIQADLVYDIIRMSGEFAPELIKLQGSASVVEHVQRTLPRVVIDKLFPHETKANMRFRVNKKLHALASTGKMTSGSVSPKKVKGRTKSFSKVLLASKLPNKSRKKRGEQGAKTSQSPIALRNLLNEMLPQMVASKMTSPALQFRTGRFANSARVENVNVGPRGGTHIDYTYMRNPYETFEPGNKQGSTQRDPRKIIGASIRELAMGIIGRQPTTIRRN